MAILAGDFLLARASVSLAALRNSDVIQLLSQVIEDLVSGEIMQVRRTMLVSHVQTSCPNATAAVALNPCDTTALTSLNFAIRRNKVHESRRICSSAVSFGDCRQGMKSWPR